MTARRFSRFRVVDDDREEGDPWFDIAPAAELLETCGVYTPLGIALIEELFDRSGRPAQGWLDAVGFEGVVVAGPHQGLWIEGPADDLMQVRVH